MDFFVIAGSSNTISGHSIPSLELFNALFPLNSMEPATSDSEQVDYDNVPEMSTAIAYPSSPNLLDTSDEIHQEHTPIFRFFPPLPEEVDIYCHGSQPLVHNLHTLTIWNKDGGHFYGTQASFQYDNGTDIPVISMATAERLNLHVHISAQALTVKMGYSNIS